MNAAMRLGAAVGLAVMVGGFGLGRAEAHATDVVVAVPNPSAINNFALHTAIGEGIFEKNGLNVTVEAVDGSSQVLQAMAAGQAQIGQPTDGSIAIGPSFNAESRGGVVREIEEGDIVVIPAGLMHAWTSIPDHVTYLSVRIDPNQVLPAGYVNPEIN